MLIGKVLTSDAFSPFLQSSPIVSCGILLMSLLKKLGIAPLVILHCIKDTCKSTTAMLQPGSLFKVTEEGQALCGDVYSDWQQVDSDWFHLTAEVLCVRFPGPVDRNTAGYQSCSISRAEREAHRAGSEVGWEFSANRAHCLSLLRS